MRTGQNERLLSFLKELIQFDTTNPPGNEKDAAHYVGEKLGQYGFRIEYQKVGEKRENVIASIGDSQRKEVILTGHLDVVPAGEGWTVEPFQMTRKEKKLFGRGSCDMKGGVAAMMEAALRISRKPEFLRGKKVTLAFVCDEEVKGIGSRVFVNNHKPAEEVLTILGEPTGMQIQIAHRGIGRFRVEIEGKQAHAAMPEKGINPILEMCRFLTAVENFNEDRQKKSYGVLPPPVITPTIVHAQVKENVIPAKCSVLLDCRTVEGETEEMLRGQLTLLFLESRKDPRTSVRIETLLYAPVGFSPEDGMCCRLAKRAMEKIKWKNQRVSHFNGSTDMPIFTENGYENTIICGPGQMEMAHQTDEYVEEEQLEWAAAFYEKFIMLA